MKTMFKAVSAAALLIAAASQVQAAPVTWGVTATVGTAVVTGTATFDNATTLGFYDGIADPNDTHVNASFNLSSAALGWNNVVFTGVSVQPYFYASYGDGPHADYSFSSNGWSLYLNDGNYAQLSSSSMQSGTWSFNRNLDVPEPTSLALVGAALLALARRQSRR